MLPNTDQEILTFWFDELEPAQHWKKDPEFDQMLRDRFGPIHTAATQCETWVWRETAEGRLAEIIVLDQFSRNIFRDEGQAFAWDSLALALSQEAIRAGADANFDEQRQAFLYMPFMHSESAAMHEIAMELFKDLPNLDFEIKHKAIIDRFGRYPHRNAALGRSSTAEEIEFLKGPDSSF